MSTHDQCTCQASSRPSPKRRRRRRKKKEEEEENVVLILKVSAHYQKEIVYKHEEFKINQNTKKKPSQSFLVLFLNKNDAARQMQQHVRCYARDDSQHQQERSTTTVKKKRRRSLWIGTVNFSCHGGWRLLLLLLLPTTTTPTTTKRWRRRWRQDF